MDKVRYGISFARYSYPQLFPVRALTNEDMMQKVNVMNGISGKALKIVLYIMAAAVLAGCATVLPEAAKEKIPVFPPAPDEPRFYYERSIYSSADVEKEEKGADLRRRFTGEGRSGEFLGKPYGVAVFQGRVYVTDTVNKNVAAFDIPGQRYFKIGEDEDGHLVVPIGLDVDGKGNLYVVDNKAKNVQVYDGNGKYQRTLGGGNMFSRPSGIAVDEGGTRVYVVDTGGVTADEYHRVRALDAKTGKHLFDIGKRGNEPGNFNLPRDVSIGKDGLLYVVDGGNFRVQVFKPDGTFVRVFGEVGRQAGMFSRPKEVANDADGNVYVVDSAFGNFQIFSPAGDLLMAVGSRSERDGMAKYMLPSGIAVDGDGRVYMVDQYFRKVDVYRPAKLAADAGFTTPKQPDEKK
jgi:DNA-binding beta-propeller fold protein YncE